MGIVINRIQNRWPANILPFQIDPAIAGNPTALGFVNAAIQHWNSNTPFRLIPRSTETDFVIFQPNPTACSSAVGKIGGAQQISCALASGNFNASSVIHEIAHAIGFWHEQSRSDRDAFVTIVTAAIQPANLHNFAKHDADGTDIGPYDYGSIMHYPNTAFAIVPGTITIIAPVPIGTASVLSAGDINTAQSVAARSLQSDAFPGKCLRMDGRGAFNTDGGGLVNCQNVVGAWERFHLERQTDGTTAIASAAFPGKYLRMDGRGAFNTDGGGLVNCQNVVGAWEKFHLVQQPDGTVAVESVAFPGKYLRLDGRGAFNTDGGGRVNCQNVVGAWEKFRVIF